MSSLARHSVANAVASGSILLGGTLSTIAVARLLGPDRLGVVTYGAWLVSLALIVADLGIPGALARYLPDLRRREQGAADGLTAYLLRGFAAAAATAVLAFAGVALWLHWRHEAPFGPVTPDHYLSNPVFWLLAAGAILGQSASSLTAGLLRGRLDFGRMARLMLVAALVQIVVTAAGAVLGGLTGALLGGIAVGLVPLVFLAGSLPRGAPVPPDLRRRVHRYCRTTWASYLLSAIVWTRTEIFFLERSWGSGAVALFSVGVTLANLAVQLPLLLTGSLLPHFAQHIAAGEHAQAVALYRTSMRLLAMMVFPACFGVVAIAPALVPLLYGSGFEGAVLPTAILVGASALSALTSVTQTFMNASERNGFNVAVGLVGALGVVLAGLLLVPTYGLLAAAAARTGIQLCTAAASIWYVDRLGAPAPLSAIGRILGASCVCAATAHAVVAAIPGPSAVAAAIPAGVVAYAVGLKLFGCITEPDRRLMQGLTDALPNAAARLMSGAVRFYG